MGGAKAIREGRPKAARVVGPAVIKSYSNHLLQHYCRTSPGKN
jgi:hypothetical protein